jgi:formylglycine-generating enzyme required for sulfatase activity
MNLLKTVFAVILCCFSQVALPQVSNVEDVEPMQGVVIAKVQQVQSAALGAVFKDCEVCPEMVAIPAGSFLMGTPPPEGITQQYDAINASNTTEKPQHKVTLKGFAIGKYEVTQEQWLSLIGTYPSSHKNKTKKIDKKLPIDLNWYEAKLFVQKLSETTGKKYRLPSEAEWEYAARGGTSTKYFFSDDDNLLSEFAWYELNSSNKKQQVGLKKPNKFGLFDILGNVLEWVEDCWHGDYVGAPNDGSAWVSGRCDLRVLRGGAVSSGPHELKVSYRYWNYKHSEYGVFGIRVVRDL